jgi:NADH dehydrogenase
MSHESTPRVVVLGAGFAGLRAVHRLGAAGVRTLWLDRNNYHCFLPLLYQVATAGLQSQDLAYPTRSILRHMPSVTFRLANVVEGDPQARVLVTEHGDRIPWDQLIIATGGSAEDFGVPGARDVAFHLYDLEDAQILRNHILRMLERAAAVEDPAERAPLLTFVIVGGGATGVEMSGALGELRGHVVPRDYPEIDPASVRIIMIEAGGDVLAAFPPSLRTRARQDLEGFDVEIRPHTRVTRITPEYVELAGGERVRSHTTVWAAGIRAATVAGHLGLPTGKSGRIKVGPTLAVPGHPDVYATGDVALVEGAEHLPQVAQVAIQQGDLAAENVIRTHQGRALGTFSYDDKGSMATIGRSRAVAVIKGVHLRGRIAWWAWLLVHLIMLMGFRNRATVLLNWAWNYITYDRGMRAIVGRLGSPAVEETREAQRGSG